MTVTDANGCSTQSSINITQPPVLTLVNSGDIALACGGDTNGAGTFTAAGGTAPYNFTVDSNTTGGTTSTTATTLDFITAGAGAITVTVTDANGCTAQSTLTTTEPPVLTLTTTGDILLNCNGDTNGAGTFTAAGGTPGYTFTVDVNTTGSATSTTATTLDFNGAGIGVITITVTDANGCSQQATINVTQPPAITLNTTGDILLGCNGDTDGAGTFTAGGGTPGYTFTVDTNTTGATTSTTATTLDFAGAGIGTITVTVTDANGCSTQSTINVTQPPVLVLTPSADVALLCNGDSNGAGTFTASGGTAPYAFTVDANTTGGATSITATTLDFSGAGAGAITVTVTDANGCSQQATINVTEPVVLTLVTTGDILLGCNGDTDGAGTFTTGGGTPGYTFTIDTNTTGAATSTTATTLDFTGAGIGVITVTVTDANGCSQQATINVTQPPVLTLVNSGDIALSCGGDTTGAGTFTAAGGTAPYIFTVDANTTGGTTSTTATTLDFANAGAA
ncbi:MAG: hypothetical protein HC859_07995 [Bacteroidia bacterium]|nr:hypothetical protein [Bacteroidia bacterium]